MINSLFLITKGALLTPSTVSFGKIVFCQDLFSVQKPHEDPNLQW
jgi:hypothetical protein